eukprot:gene23343-179_t
MIENENKEMKDLEQPLVQGDHARGGSIINKGVHQKEEDMVDEKDEDIMETGCEHKIAAIYYSLPVQVSLVVLLLIDITFMFLELFLKDDSAQRHVEPVTLVTATLFMIDISLRVWLVGFRDFFLGS